MATTPLPAIAIAVALVAQTNQTLINPNPSDARMNQFEEAKGTSWRVFAVDAYVGGPLAITEVQEIRQQNPPSTWAVLFRNRSLAPLISLTMAAAIMSGDGTLKGIQPLPAIKNLGPGNMRRQEMRVQVTVLAPTDRVVFFVNEVSGEMTPPWKAQRSDIVALITAAAKRLPVP